MTSEYRETFTSAVSCPEGACKQAKEVISAKNLMKNLDIYLNFADLAVRSQRGKSTSRSVLTAKRPDLSAQSPTRALKEPVEALCAASPEALTHSPSQMPLSCPVAPPSQSARAAPRRRRRRWWRGDEGARRPGPVGQVLRHVLWHVLHNALRCVLYVPVLHVT